VYILYGELKTEKGIHNSGDARIGGYVLLNLITVIFAIITGAFALQIGETLQHSPLQATFGAQYSAQEWHERPHCRLGSTDGV